VPGPDDRDAGPGDPRPDPAGPGSNWSGTYSYRAKRLHHPRSVEDLQRLVRTTDRIRPLGSRHSFNDIADCDGDLVSLDAMPSHVTVDHAARTATVSAGLPYSSVAERLSAAGYGLSAMASLPHISLAVACATGTHVSGDRFGGLATAVIAAEFVDGRGELVHISRADDPEIFPGTVVSLGALGVMTSLTLSLVPYYQVAQTVLLDLPADTLANDFDRVYRAGDSVSCFTRWQGGVVDQVWVKRRVAESGGDGDNSTGGDGDNSTGGDGDTRTGGDGDPRPVDLPGGARPAQAQVNPVPGGDPTACTRQGGVPGPWHDRLPHFRAGHRPSSGDEIQSEYFVAREHAPAAIRALFDVGAAMAGALQIAEIRTIAADDLWLSPAYRQDSVAFHFTWTSDAAAVLAVLPDLERALAPFQAVPHWGKVFTAGPEVFRRRYRRLPEFVDLARRHDPDGRFAGDFLNRYVFATG
jgi:xylitol oxidase